MSDLLNKASLVMVPSGYKEDTVYSVVPSDGSGDLSFTRASNGTRINSAGLVEVVAWNLVEYSEDFTNSVWTKKSTISLTANATTAPNGTNTATKMYANSSGTVDYGCFQILTSQSATLSVYAKKSELNYLFIGFNNDFANEGVFFNLNTGAISQNTGGYTASIESVGNGWYRCIAYFPTISLCFISPSVSGTSFVFSNENNNGIYIWGAQLNIGSTAKPYFPTTDRLNVPRLTYQNGGGGCPSLLLEKQSTNTETWSEDFSNASWTKTNCSITANTTTSPDGTQNADKIIENSVNGVHFVYNVGATISVAQTLSVYAKADTRTQLALQLGASSVIYNLSSGTIVSGSGGSIQSVGNGWYRCSITTTPANTNALIFTANGGTNSYQGDGTSGLFIWGAQLEAGAYPTSYIPTTSSSATRVADACSKTGISSLIGQSEGVLFVQFSVPIDELVTRSIVLSGATTDNRVALSTYGGSVFARVDVGGTNQVNSSASMTGTNMNKVAFRYKANDFAVYVNGTKVITDTSGSTFSGSTLDRFAFIQPDSTSPFNGNVAQIVIFPTGLTDTQLASLTTL